LSRFRFPRLALFLGGLLLAAAGEAQSLGSLGIGAVVGYANSVDQQFRLDQFHPYDHAVWLQYRTWEDVDIRATFGQMKVAGHNAGQAFADSGGATETLPDLKSRIDYGTLTAAYMFGEEGWSSGLFGGVGAYRIRPLATSPGLDAFRDPSETVWGLNFGVETHVRIWRQLAGVARVEMHLPQSHPKRQIVGAGVGLLYHF
jgi:hypothetical protein